MNIRAEAHRVGRAATLGGLANALVFGSAAVAFGAPSATTSADRASHTEPPQKGVTRDAETPAVDSAVLARLKEMGSFLRDQKTFSVHEIATTDEVLANGQKAQFGGTVDLWVTRPNRMRVRVDTDHARRSLFYDGKTFTQYGSDTGYYATFAAPPTIGELIDLAQERYGIQMPLVDLFKWGTVASDLSKIREATDLGPSTIENTPCEHYALRQKSVDWQVWVATGDQPLPRKIVITTLDERSEPQHTSLLGWNLAPKLDANAFRFVPPDGAKPVVFESFDTHGGPLGSGERR